MGLLQAGDPHGDVATMWQAKEAVRELHAHADLALQWVEQLGADPKMRTTRWRPDRSVAP